MKRAFVTGSSRGIGRAIALALAGNGFDVAVHGRSESDALFEVAGDIEKAGVKAATVVGDIGRLGERETLLNAAEDGLGGRLTTLVCNAGVGPLRAADILDVQEDSWDHVLHLNAKSQFFMAQSFAKRLIGAEFGRDVPLSISFVTSVSAFASSVDKAEYCVSKAAAGMVAKTFAQRLAGEGIQVFDIQPGIIETDLSRPVLERYGKMIDDCAIALIPRFGQPEDVGAAVAAAASGALPYSVGHVLRMDGGLTLQRL